jgi:hypothetical protein
MKERKHHDVIVAWAKGAKVEAKPKPYLCLGKEWEEQEYPCFFTNWEYRVKPREFEEAAFYVARNDFGEGLGCRLMVVEHLADRFYQCGTSSYYTEQDFSYIGDKIELEDYVEDDSI